MLSRRFLIILFVLCLPVIGLVSCKAEDGIVDKRKYRKAIVDCDESISYRNEACVRAHFIRETELYCASKDIPTKDCDLIESKVRSKLSDYAAEIERESK
jgi:hypothetical protein